MPTVPYSLTITAVPWPSGETRKRRIKVVLPAPRKPVTTVTGMRAPRSRLSRRPNGPASRGEKVEHREDLGSKIHLQNVEPADVTIDGVDDAALVDEHIVHLDRSGRRAGWRRRHENADLLRLVRIGNVVSAQAAVK